MYNVISKTATNEGIMNLYESAKIIALQVLTQKWGSVTAGHELEKSRCKIHSIVMGESDSFSFSFYLESGRVHDFKIRKSVITHKIHN